MPTDQVVTLSSLNSWSGGFPRFHSFIQQQITWSDYIGLQEVHDCLDPKTPAEVMPKRPGSRIVPIRPNLRAELDTLFGDDWETTYAQHVDGCHDLEEDDRMQYGQYSAVRNDTFEVLYTSHRFIFGKLNQFNTEEAGGMPCGKVAIGHLLKLRTSATYLAVVNVHGFWSKMGKVDLLERFVQNSGINECVKDLLQHAPTPQVHVVVIGDLNYTSRMIALYDLAQGSVFDPEGSVILNHHYGIKNTRTEHYQKPIREADFAIVSRSLLPHVKNFAVELTGVPSDHGLLRLELKL